MSLALGKVGIALIGPPGSGKTTLGSEVVKGIPGWRFDDQDNNGLEHPNFGLGKGGVALAVRDFGDKAFLEYELDFTLHHYGTADENKPFTLDNVVLGTSGSLVKSRDAIHHIRQRTHVIFLDVPIDVVLENIKKRSDGAGRIIGMNGGPHGEKPTSATLQEELEKRAELYMLNHDSRLPYEPGEGVEQTTKRLLTLIHTILR